MEDYKSLHLNWIKSNKNFVPKNGNDLSEPYYDIMRFTYQQPNSSQNYAKICLIEDIEWKKKSCKVLGELSIATSSSTRHFVTIGFNHQTWSVASCVAVIKRIMALDWIDNATAVFELHRENGEHPHCHFLIDTKFTKSKILEKLWAVKDIKKIVLQKSFIDYKVAQDYHVKYINGDKIENKMPYVEKDILWRQENNIEQLFKKTT